MKFSLVLVLILLLAAAVCPFAFAPLDRLLHPQPTDVPAAVAQSAQAVAESASPAE